MANHDYRTASSPLSQLVLIKSPYLQLPHPVTLPYNYTPLPSSVDTIPTTDFSQVLSSVELSVQRITELKSEHDAHLERIKSWEDQIHVREVREQRRIAPGYLDTDQRLLMPTRVDSPLVESPTTRGGTDGNDTVTNDLGKAFGNMGV